MIYIEKNDKLIDKLKDNLSLTSSSILRIETYLKDELVIVDVYISLLYEHEKNNLMLKFTGVRSFLFSYASTHFFYNIEIVKFFCTDEKRIYISFDPVDENEVIDINDNDFVESDEVEGYFLD